MHDSIYTHRIQTLHVYISLENLKFNYRDSHETWENTNTHDFHRILRQIVEQRLSYPILRHAQADLFDECINIQQYTSY
jgi:hypothetical protein